MNELFRHIGEGDRPSANEYNRLVDAVMALLKSSNVQYFADSRGVHIRRMPEPLEVSRVRRAYVKNTPGATVDVDVYLDTDDSSTEVTVTVKIYAGGGFLNTAEPLLTDGDDFLVWLDGEIWRNVTTFFKVGIC